MSLVLPVWVCRTRHIQYSRAQPRHAPLHTYVCTAGFLDSLLDSSPCSFFFSCPCLHMQGKSIRSFPSGHSSMSMAGTLYVTLVCWGDLSRFASDHKSWRRSLLVGPATQYAVGGCVGFVTVVLCALLLSVFIEWALSDCSWLRLVLCLCSCLFCGCFFTSDTLNVSSRSMGAIILVSEGNAFAASAARAVRLTS